MTDAGQVMHAGQLGPATNGYVVLERGFPSRPTRRRSGDPEPHERALVDLPRWLPCESDHRSLMVRSVDGNEQR
jgi:hypothetical protein